MTGADVLPSPSALSRLLRVAEMQALERAADASGHSFAAMMEAAGAAVARAILEQNAPHLPRPLILVGPGNNGGDGLVCARHLLEAGAQPRVFVWKRTTGSGGIVDEQLARLSDGRVEIAHVEDDPQLDRLDAWLEEADILVDALLGTGANRPFGEDLGALLDHCRAALNTRPHLRVCAVDCPSGLNNDTGAADSLTLPADFTVTFASAKWGHYRFPGAALCGEIVVADIGIAAAEYPPPGAFVLSPALLAPLLPDRKNVSHKGSFGKVIGAVGSVSYPGAAALSLGAAGRVGAGLVTGAIPEPLWPVVAAHLREPTWLLLPAIDGAFGAKGAAILHNGCAGYDALLLGCGISQAESTVWFVDALLNGEELPPTLIDADGLNCLTRIGGWPGRLPAQCVLTPHPAEFARLLDCPVAEVTAQRWELALEAAARWNAVVLVKGPYTVIAEPGGRLAVLPIATPALATAGTGDVLSGAIAGLMAQGLTPFAAACVGAWLHGAAGLLCEAQIGRAGVVAGDVLDRLPAALLALAEGTEPTRA